MSTARGRRGYLDWVRGLAVLVMIQAHVLDSWTRLDARGSWQFAWAMIVAGFGAPIFLFLAGVSVALSAGSKARRSGDPHAAAVTVMKRGGWIFFLAFVFRLQAWILGWGPPRTLLKVDVLNIMGPAIAAAACLWGLFRTTAARGAACAAAAGAIALLAPIVRASPMLDPLPDPIEAYLRPAPPFSAFPIFPWVGFVFAGAVVGVLVAGTRTDQQESALNRRLAIAGALIATGAYALSFLPTPYPQSDFWGESPTFFALRAGILTLLIPCAYLWNRLIRAGARNPIQQLGRTSLFIYWIHVEMVYGLISLRVHKKLTHPQAWLAFGGFALFMLVCSIGKDRIVRWREEHVRRKGQTQNGAAAT